MRFVAGYPAGDAPAARSLIEGGFEFRQRLEQIVNDRRTGRRRSGRIATAKVCRKCLYD